MQQLRYTHQWLVMQCACGRTFQGRDEARMVQHYTSHEKRCTWGRKRRRVKGQP